MCFRASPGPHEFHRVLIAGDASTSGHRDIQGPADLEHHPDRHRPDGRTGQASDDVTQQGSPAVIIDGHAQQGIDQGQSVDSGFRHPGGDGHDVGYVG